jgi:hypothetical protein
MAMSSTAGSSNTSVLASLADLHEASKASMLIDNSNFFISDSFCEKSSEPLQKAARLIQSWLYLISC